MIHFVQIDNVRVSAAWVSAAWNTSHVTKPKDKIKRKRGKPKGKTKGKVKQGVNIETTEKPPAQPGKKWLKRSILSLCTSCKDGFGLAIMDVIMKTGRCFPYMPLPRTITAKVGWHRPAAGPPCPTNQNVLATKLILARPVLFMGRMAGSPEALLHFSKVLKGVQRGQLAKVIDGRKSKGKKDRSFFRTGKDMKKRAHMGKNAIAECYVRKETVCRGADWRFHRPQTHVWTQECQVRKQVKCHQVCQLAKWSTEMPLVKLYSSSKGKKGKTGDADLGKEKGKMSKLGDGVPQAGRCFPELCEGEYGAMACRTAALVE
jgi:hypothetical protein